MVTFTQHSHRITLECGHGFDEHMDAEKASVIHGARWRTCSDVECGFVPNGRRVIRISGCENRNIDMDAPEPIYSQIPVKGYRELTQTEIDAMNNLKRSEEWIAKQWEEYALLVGEGEMQQEMLRVAKTHFKIAFMCMNRAVARPTNEW